MTMFLILAAVALLSALAVVFNKNVVHSALFLLVNFATLAVFYFMLNAQFLGVAQLLVYAGAIVVLFLFVVMLIGGDFGEPVTFWINGKNIFLIILGLILLTVVGTAVFESTVNGAGGQMTQETVSEFGQVQAVASVLFTKYTLPFQLVAVILSVGIIGVVWLAQHQQRQRFRTVIAVLDSGWAGETRRVNHDRQRVNCLNRPQLFDFDWIEIKQATDEDVERFVARLGNDTDPWRQSRYPQMRVTVSPDCNLSDNTVRVLRDMFGEVRFAEVERVV